MCKWQSKGPGLEELTTVRAGLLGYWTLLITTGRITIRRFERMNIDENGQLGQLGEGKVNHPAECQLPILVCVLLTLENVLVDKKGVDYKVMISKF